MRFRRMWPKIMAASMLVSSIVLAGGLERNNLILTAGASATSTVTADTEAVMQPNDGLHFGEEGYRTLAKFFAERLRA